MAINKAIENEYGASFNYHKIREVRLVNDDSGNIQLSIIVYSWIDKQARIDGKQPTVRQCIIQNADFAMKPFYALLKAKFPDFAAGEDDLDNSFKETQNKANTEYIVQTGNGDLIKKWQEAK